MSTPPTLLMGYGALYLLQVLHVQRGESAHWSTKLKYWKVMTLSDTAARIDDDELFRFRRVALDWNVQPLKG